MFKKVTTETLVESLREKFGDRFDYSLVEYHGQKAPVTLICPLHGPVEVTPKYLQKSPYGCPQCGVSARNSRLDTSEVVRQLTVKFGDRYDYSEVEYTGVDNEITVVCRDHGPFRKTFHRLMSLPCGCPQCGKESFRASRQLSEEDIRNRAEQKWPGKFDLTRMSYTGPAETITVGCPKHGDIHVYPHRFLQTKYGCPQCAREHVNMQNQLSIDDWKNNCYKKFGDKFDLAGVSFESYREDNITVTCPKHGSFQTRPLNFYVSQFGCAECAREDNPRVSRGETELVSFIKSQCRTLVKCGDRKVLNGQELDVYVPGLDLAVEFNGLYYHSEFCLNNPRTYHLEKTVSCENQGVHLVHIFEDEWKYKQDIVKSVIRNFLGTSQKVYARKCTVREVPSRVAREFLDRNHLQGYCTSAIKLGLYLNNRLVSLMTFGKRRVHMGTKTTDDNEYELLRFCNVLNTTVIGGASKLFGHFIREYCPEKITSYCDRRLFTGNLYETLGMTLDHISQPNYFYVTGDRRENRFKYRKDVLVKEGFDPAKSEHQIMQDRKIPRIYDCGNYVYIWTKKEELV